MTTRPPERWLSGPVEGVPPLLQPIAHAFYQTLDDLEATLEGFPEDLLWSRPAGVASVGFHLQHIRGVIDRLFTYARGEPLSEDQLTALVAEGELPADGTGAAKLIDDLRRQVEVAVGQLRSTSEASLVQPRSVGRAGLPSTVIGLLFHAAEHTQRHTGQLLVTVRVQRPSEP